MSKTRTAKAMVCAMVCVLSMATCAEETSVPTVSDEPALGVGVSAAFMSKYIWRGQLLNDDYVMQPSVGLTYGNWSASLWGNVDMTDYHDNDWEFTEYDWTIGYADKIPGFDILKYSMGAIYYYFPSVTDDSDTVEVYAGLGLDMPLSPTLTMYRDIDEGDGTYVAFSVSHAIEKIAELSPDMPVGMTASASLGWASEGYNKFYWGGLSESGMQDLTLSVGFPIPVLGWTLTPSINYVTLLDSDVRAADTYATYSGNNDSDYVFTGITLSTSF
ncbi:MAG: hypothetical protein JXB18_12425 [Sedimentisphaerales bacterium]|nr:hypothetical protein [Sedimentisphaerales bacterium]